MLRFTRVKLSIKLLIIISFLSAAGCAGTGSKTVNDSILSSLQGKTLSLIIHEAPDFLAITPEKNMLNQAGFNAAVTDGNQLVQERGIYDPAGELSRRLAEAIHADYGLVYDADLVKKSRARDTKALVRLANRRDYALSVETSGWLFTHNIKHKNYHVKYYATARLIDVGQSRVIWKNSCEYDSLAVGNPLVSYQQLLEDDAAYLKQSLDEASEICANYFFADLRGE